MTIYAAFRLSVSEAEAEIMYLPIKEMPEPTTIFGLDPAGQVYNQPNQFVCI